MRSAPCLSSVVPVVSAAPVALSDAEKQRSQEYRELSRLLVDVDEYVRALERGTAGSAPLGQSAVTLGPMPSRCTHVSRVPRGGCRAGWRLASATCSLGGLPLCVVGKHGGPARQGEYHLVDVPSRGTDRRGVGGE